MIEGEGGPHRAGPGVSAMLRDARRDVNGERAEGGGGCAIAGGIGDLAADELDRVRAVVSRGPLATAAREGIAVREAVVSLQPEDVLLLAPRYAGKVGRG